MNTTQNTNMWNAQNGITAQPPVPMPTPNTGQMGYQQQQTSPNPPPWMTQNWRNYSPGPNIPFRGRYITSIDEVNPREVDGDGYPSYYPTQDWSSIYVKVWSNGELKTFRFVPERDPIPQAPQPDNTMNWSGVFENFASLMDARYSKLEDKIDDLLTQLTPKTTTTKGGSKT